MKKTIILFQFLALLLWSCQPKAAKDNTIAVKNPTIQIAVRQDSSLDYTIDRDSSRVFRHYQTGQYRLSAKSNLLFKTLHFQA